MSAIFGNGKPKENSGSKNHSAPPPRPTSKPGGPPNATAAARPANARHRVSHSGRYTVPSINTVTQRITISDTGGNTKGFTRCIRVTTTPAMSSPATGRKRARLVSERMPGKQPAQAGEVETIEQTTQHREVDHHR